MLFNSLEYALFFWAFFAVYSLLTCRWQARKWLLLFASYLFYMGWNPPFVSLLILSTLLDYLAGRHISRSERPSVRRAWLIASVTGNLGVLGFFKYSDFLLSNVWRLATPDIAYPAFVENIVLPVGISFYTFQSLSYTIDVYRRQTTPADSLLEFAVYVSFFPQLLAGPIVRAGEFLPQLAKPRQATAEDGLTGIDQIIRGFAKKVIIADGLAAYVDMVYANPGSFGALNQLIAIYAYAFQLYCDFSGYSDIAIGTARILGFRIPRNFNLPYLARSPVEFWARWHISLSTWLRDYLYISLGGSRRSTTRTYVNVAVTMILGGLWHGAAWNFVLWGAFHTGWSSLHRAFVRDRGGLKLPNALLGFVTFHILCVSWILFRSESIENIGVTFAAFFDFDTPTYRVSPWVLLLLVVAALSHMVGASKRLAEFWSTTHIAIRATYYMLVVVAVFHLSTATERFIYFQF
ncbi:MAG: MBOAT family protein [Myxococcota bacterium]